MKWKMLLVLSLTCISMYGFADESFENGDSSDPTCSWPSGELFVVGDSHALFFDQVGIMKSHWTGPIHSATIYQMLKLGLDLFHLQQKLAVSDHYVYVGPPAWQCPSGKYTVPNIKRGDCVIFSFGFNDIQKNIHKYAANRSEEEIDRLMRAYILRLKRYETTYQITCIPMSVPPNPSPCDPGAMGALYYGISGDFSTSGSSDERNAYTKYANKVLKSLCQEYDLRFFDVYDELSDEGGFLKKELTHDYIHLKCDDPFIVKKMRIALSKALN